MSKRGIVNMYYMCMAGGEPPVMTVTLADKWDKLNSRRTSLPFGVTVKFGHRNLTELRFADEVILVAQSCADVSKMLRHLSETFAKYGLKLHFGKTKLMTWNCLAGQRRRANIGGQTVDILDEQTSERAVDSTDVLADT